MRNPCRARYVDEMNTPTHMLIGAAVFARQNDTKLLVAALLGGTASDVPMLGLVLWKTQMTGLPDHEVFGQLYYSDAWQAVFAVDHSLLLWSSFLAVAVRLGLDILRALAGAGLLHAFADFLTHHDDARRQLWPLSDWVFRSPVSYWDSRYFGDAFGVFELVLGLVLAVFLFWRIRLWWQRALVLSVAAILILPVVVTGGFHGLHGMG